MEDSEPIDSFTGLPVLSFKHWVPVYPRGFYLWAGDDYRIELPFTFTVCRFAGSKEFRGVLFPGSGEKATRGRVYGPLELTREFYVRQPAQWTEDRYLVALLDKDPGKPAAFAVLNVREKYRNYWSCAIPAAQFCESSAAVVSDYEFRGRVKYSRRPLTEVEHENVSNGLPLVLDEWFRLAEGYKVQQFDSKCVAVP